MESKRCRHCGHLKSLENFPKRKNGTVYQYCYFCNTERQHTKDPCEYKRLLKQRKFRCSRCSKILSLKQKGLHKHYKRRCKKCIKYAELRRHLLIYNISPIELNQLLAAQQNKCKVCKSSLLTNKRTKIRIDHNHKTGRIRGLLCHRCNLFIGYIEKSPPGLLAKLLKYIET